MNEAMMVYAFRYALGRMTYAVSEVIDELKARWPELSDKTRGVILDDLASAIDRDDRYRASNPGENSHALGSEMDARAWREFDNWALENRTVARTASATDRVVQLETAIRAVLLFHSSTLWDDGKRTVWRSLTGTDEATTKTLCDAIRKVLR